MAKLRLFVYGSLKSKEYNWHVISAGVESCQRARLRGTIFLRHDGYPALVLAHSLATLGSSRYQEDLQEAWRPESPLKGDTLVTPPSVPLKGDTGPSVEGQLLILSPGQLWLQRLDEFEGFFPGSPSEYLRVLTSVEVGPNEWHKAWTYTAAAAPPPHWRRIEAWNRSMVENLKPYQHGLGEGTDP